jgi:BirA family biotin operon repressor/biotin-[acetyl-CoA-carboxylase] ligase
MFALDSARIESTSPGWQVSVVDSIASTQDRVAAMAGSGAMAPAALFARQQTQGRGRRGQPWHSPMGENLAFSALLDPPGSPALWPRITALSALALCLSIEQALGLRALIKWPNDLWMQSAKVAGLLADVVQGPQGPRLVLGVGLNVNSLNFPPHLQTLATSLRLQLGPSQPVIDLNTLASCILCQLATQLERIEEGYAAALEEIRQRSLLLGRWVEWQAQGRHWRAKALDLNSEGHLLLKDSEGATHCLSSAESIRPIDDEAAI